MKLLITGASGFLGRYVVDEALRRGHDVGAMVRPASDVSKLAWAEHSRVTLVRADLRSRRGLADAVRGFEAVLHLAADKAGEFYSQMAGNVVATENLLLAMAEAGVARLVLVSSFSVYQYLNRRAGSIVDEDSPLETDFGGRDDYAHTKSLQERVARELAGRHNIGLTVLRPGVIYGPGNTWTPRLGAQLSEQRWLRIGSRAALPLTYVGNCAEAIVLASERANAAGATFNVVDDDPPTQKRYLKLLAARTTPRPRVVPINFTLMRAIAATGSLVNRVCFGGRARVPAILRPAALHARCKPMRYTNDRIKQSLGWTPRLSLEAALNRCFETPAAASASSEQQAAAVSVS